MSDEVETMTPVPEYCADEDLPLEKRQEQMREIQELRAGRKLVVLANWDRITDSGIPGLQTQFAADVKEPLYRAMPVS